MILVADTNALYGETTRALLILFARERLFTLYWSQQIADEAEHLKIDLPHEFLYPGDFSEGPLLGLPDLQDEHVLRLALACNANGIITYNQRDFPQRLIGRLRCMRPDDAFMECLGRDEDRTMRVLRAHCEDSLETDWKAYCARLNRAQLHRLSVEVADL